MRRILLCLLAFVLSTATLLVLPVYAAPAPQAHPVAPDVDAKPMGSVEAPTGSAVVTADGVVTDAGPQAAVDPGTKVAANDSPSAAPSAAPSASPSASPSAAPSAAPSPSADTVASSGKEIGGVPALTLSQPDTKKFSTVGVTWAENSAVSDVNVQLRTKRASGTWTAWTTVEQDDTRLQSPGGVVDPDQRGGTEPYWAGPSYGVEVTVQAASGAMPADVKLVLVDPGTSAADAAQSVSAPRSTAHAAMLMPAIHTRAQWGADESLRTWDPEYAPTIKAATIHHTADSNSYTAADVPGIMRSIYAFQAVSRGWGDIGYNVVVDKFGGLWEGRYGGLTSTVVGAHAAGFNYETFGVSMIGNFDIAPTTPAMIDAVASVVAWKFSLYGVDPKGTTTLISAGLGGTSKFAAGVAVALPTIFAHRDTGNTICPGKYAYAQMGNIRNLVAQKMADPSLQQWPQFFLRKTNTTGKADLAAYRGNPGDVPISCDWNGDGVDSVAVFRRGVFYLFDSNDQNAKVVAQFAYGDAGDTPICGDWNGDGKQTVGVWRNGWFYLRNSNTTGKADVSFAFGNVDAQPVTGNWDGDASDSVGVYQNNVFYWTNSIQRPLADGSLAYGDRGDRLVAGDWTGSGSDTVGVYRAGRFYLADSLTTKRADEVIDYGVPSDRPLVGDWTGGGRDTIGVSRGY